MLRIDDSEGLPLRCVLFLFDANSGSALSSVPVELTAELKVDNSPTAEITVPLGVLATDHVGYASWDLRPLRRRLGNLLQEADPSVGRVVVLDRLMIRLSGPLLDEVDALIEDQASGDAFVLRHGVDPAAVHQTNRSLPAVQEPSLIDWYLSPASFSTLPTVLVGSDGCETMLPSNVAPYRFSLFQIIRPRLGIDIDLSDNTPAGNTPPHLLHVGDYKFASKFLGGDAQEGVLGDKQFEQRFEDAELGWVITYNVTWVPSGHGLGQVVYSLPLAPAEQVRVAVIDWSRESRTSRADDQVLSETLEHDLLHDRSVSEVVDATVREWQRGGSVMGAAGASGTLGGLGLAGGLGGGYATTSGDRSVSATTTQSVLDGIRQNTTSVRNLRSTVVVTSEQSEHSSGQTRVVRNYNHSHAMTLMYYEVLRHFRVSVESDTGRPVLLLRRHLADFEPSIIFSYRRYLEPALLQPSLASAFDVIEKYQGYSLLKETAPPDPGKIEITEFRFLLQMGEWFVLSGGSYKATFDYLDDQGARQVGQIWRPDKSSNELSNPPDMTVKNRLDYVTGIPSDAAGNPIKVTWRSVLSVSFRIKLGLSDNDESKTKVGYSSYRVDVRCGDGGVHTVVDWPPGMVVMGTGEKVFSFPTLPVPAAPTAVAPQDRLTIDERMNYLRLISHLNANKTHYWRRIWLAEDPNARWIAAKHVTVTLGGDTMPVFNLCENVALDVLGDQTVFALDPSVLDDHNVKFPRIEPHREEDLVSLPTRGIFAEAKLGSCNASEIIDPDRFWDWQTSPIPDAAPEITGTDLGSRRDPTTLTPAGLPGPVAVIAQPPAVPDPLATAAAFTVLREGGIFRDMSTKEEVARLVETAIKTSSTLGKPKGGDDASRNGTGQPAQGKQSGAGQTAGQVLGADDRSGSAAGEAISGGGADLGEQVAVTATDTSTAKPAVPPQRGTPGANGNRDGAAPRKSAPVYTNTTTLGINAAVMLKDASGTSASGILTNATMIVEPLGGGRGKMKFNFIESADTGGNIPRSWTDVIVRLEDIYLRPGYSTGLNTNPKDFIRPDQPVWQAQVSMGTSGAYVVFRIPKKIFNAKVSMKAEDVLKLEAQHKKGDKQAVNAELAWRFGSSIEGSVPGLKDLGTLKTAYDVAPKISGEGSWSTEQTHGGSLASSDERMVMVDIVVQVLDLKAGPVVEVTPVPKK